MGQAAGQFVPQAAAAIGESFNTAFGFRQTDRAADKLSAAENRAQQTIRENFAQTSAELQPFLQGGTDAFNRLAAIMSGDAGAVQALTAELAASPDYQFALGQGLGALDRSAASRGRLFSGGQTQAVQQFGQGLASQNLNTFLNRLTGLANVGVNTATRLGDFRQGFTNDLTQSQRNIGDIGAAEILGLAAINDRHNLRMQDIHGVGSGGGGGGFGGFNMGTRSSGGGYQLPNSLASFDPYAGGQSNVLNRDLGNTFTNDTSLFGGRNG